MQLMNRRALKKRGYQEHKLRIQDEKQAKTCLVEVARKYRIQFPEYLRTISFTSPPPAAADQGRQTDSPNNPMIISGNNHNAATMTASWSRRFRDGINAISHSLRPVWDRQQMPASMKMDRTSHAYNLGVPAPLNLPKVPQGVFFP